MMADQLELDRWIGPFCNLCQSYFVVNEIKECGNFVDWKDMQGCIDSIVDCFKGDNSSTSHRWHPVLLVTPYMILFLNSFPPKLWACKSKLQTNNLNNYFIYNYYFTHFFIKVNEFPTKTMSSLYKQLDLYIHFKIWCNK